MSSRLDPYGLSGSIFRDRYAVEAFAGVGRFSAVYRATETVPSHAVRPSGNRDSSSSRAVALRLLKVRRNTTPSERTIIVERLRGLTQPMADIAAQCPAFAPTSEVAGLVAGGRWMPVMVQAWVEGETLESLIVSERQREVAPRSLARAIDLLTPLADALGYAHARGLVHGSLSPRSVVVRDLVRDGWKSLEVLDLGVAHALATVQSRDVAFDDDAGARIFFFATAYGSPEHFADPLPALTPASDVFSLALMTAEMITGREPLGAGDDETLERTSLDPVIRPTPRALGRDFGSFVEAIFERAVAVDPRERYATVSSFWEALRAASRISTLRPMPRSVRPPPLPELSPARSTPDGESERSSARSTPDAESERSSARSTPVAAVPFDGIDPFPEPPPSLLEETPRQPRERVGRADLAVPRVSRDSAPPPTWALDAAPRSVRDSAPPSSRRESIPPGEFFARDFAHDDVAPASETNPLFGGEPRSRSKHP